MLPQTTFFFEGPEFEGIEWDNEWRQKWSAHVNKHMKQLNDDGWRVLSVSKIDTSLAIVAEYIVPPIMISAPTYEEVEEAKAWLLKNYGSEANQYKTVLLPETDVNIERINDGMLLPQPIYVTREDIERLKRDLERT